jgi:hypothetical protein
VIMSWPADPEALLAGPRGRRLCWALAAELGGLGQTHGDPAWQQVLNYSRAADPADLASELAAAVDQTDWASVMVGMSDLDLVEELAESVTSAMFWQEPDAENEEERSAAERPADPAAPYGGHWWSSPTWAGLANTTRALAVNDARCLLAGWDPDKTYWLADVLAGAGPPAGWIRDDSVNLGWRQVDSPF